jgi:hypothetical protein
MRRLEVIEYGVIIVGLILFYDMLISVISILINILFIIEMGSESNFLEFFLPGILYCLIYAAAFILVIRQRKRIAKFINGEADDTIDLKLNKKSIIQIVIIVICLTGAISTVPKIVIYLFDSFKSSIESYDRYSDKVPDNAMEFWTTVTKLTITVVLLIFSRNISGYFDNNSDTIEISNISPKENKS